MDKEIKIETPDPVPQADGDCPNPDVRRSVRELPPSVVPPEVWAALKEAEEHAERESGTPTWIGEVDGKRYHGLGGDSCCPYHRDGGLSGISCIPSKSGNLDHLPEGSH